MHVVNLGVRVQNDMHEGAQLVFPFVVGDRLATQVPLYLLVMYVRNRLRLEAQ